MRAVIQRCTTASVAVGGRIISQIGPGLLVLIGIGDDDTPSDADYLRGKILNLRLFPALGETERSGAWKRSVTEAEFEVLCVSQFMLMAATRKGAKPDFKKAMKAEESREMYFKLLEDLRRDYRSDCIRDGKFGAMMDVQLVNDGPVTIILDSKVDLASSNKIAQPTEAEVAAIKARKKQERAEAVQRRLANANGQAGPHLLEHGRPESHSSGSSVRGERQAWPGFDEADRYGAREEESDEEEVKDFFHA